MSFELELLLSHYSFEILQIELLKLVRLTLLSYSHSNFKLFI